jgi:hypothetical protein
MIDRDKRALRLGAGAVLVALLLFRGAPAAWHSWRGAEDELGERRLLLATAEGTLADVGELERSAAGTRSHLVGLAPKLLSGATEAEAFADLTGRLALAGNRSRTRIVHSDQMADSGRVARLHRVRLHLVVESDWNGLVSFFRASVADPATLRFASVSVRSNEGASPNGPEILTGELDVSGWYLATEQGKVGR